jgi:diacylglycerol kinase family enzyme
MGDAFVPTEPDGRTVELVRKAIDEGGARRVVYMGGDGTFADVAKGVLYSSHARETVMGMLPMGTANDQGKSFGLRAGPSAIEANVKVIREERVICIDVGRFRTFDAEGNEQRADLFFDNASIGFGAAVLATRNRDRNSVASIPLVREVYRDQLVYAGALLQNALKSYATSMKFTLEVSVDGVPHRYEGLLDVIFNNTSVFGGEWVLDPNAMADDGLFEMMPIGGRRDLTAKLISTLRSNPLDDETLRQLGVEHAKPIVGKSFDLSIHRPQFSNPPPVQLDGEEFGFGDRFRIDVLGQALPLIVPRRVAERSAPSWFPPPPAR